MAHTTLSPISRETREVNDARYDSRYFVLNGEGYSTDKETFEVLRSITAGAHAIGDGTAVQAVVFLGIEAGRIKHEA